ncbi:XdhC family protein [Caulobacter sp. SLTY]|nr:XdhC family protein [Caulobacter sp. SLTY]
MPGKTLRNRYRDGCAGVNLVGVTQDLPDWPLFGLADDQRPALRKMREAGEPAVLATIAGLSGGGPRPVGAQMVFGRDFVSGFLSGGCVEGDVALHAAACLEDGAPRRLVYGEGSPWPDIRLLCGARIEIEVERIAPDDPAIGALLAAMDERRPASWTTAAGLTLNYDPAWRMVVLGADPTALATATLAAQSGFETTLVRPRGPLACPLAGVAYRRDEPATALAALDAWTAVAICGHDIDLDHAALLAALPSPAPYVGLLGARRRLAERLDRLRAADVSDRDLARLRAPIGLDLGGKAPWEIAVAVVGEVVALKHKGGQVGREAAYLSPVSAGG